MATKDPSTGLLSKMARFVRNPTKDWAELDRPEPEQESGYSKQVLKEMIERKRQNDFVRRREFDHLRKLRRNGPSISPEVAGHPSFFQSSIASNLNERATTLKKIDEIEAQMSKQWWRGKQDDVAASGDDSFARATTLPQGVDVPTVASELNLEVDSEQIAEYESTQKGLFMPGDLGLPGDDGQALVSSNRGSRPVDAGVSEFSTSKLFSIDLSAGLADPELEEAAIRFANGDDVGAEAGLLTALQAVTVTPEAADRWASALFDLYRATGQQASFDRVAIDYALRFGSSAPAWFSTPDLLGRKAAVEPAVRGTTSHQATWVCPAELDLPALETLQAALSRSPLACHVNWSQLNAISSEAAKVLSELFAQWCVTPVKLHFEGADVLESTLKAFTPSGDKGVELFWWQLRLDALRILRLQDEFELAALDFCVTYEVSPPPWQDARCEYVLERGNSASSHESSLGFLAATVPGDLSPSAALVRAGDTVAAVEVELSGEVLGDAADALDQLQAGLKGSSRLVISCARLI
ncbi:MAG: hypothetical protein V4713_17870, partial [Pseudomonadota bacterium]